MIFRELLDRSILEATRGLDPQTVALYDLDGMAENLYPQVAQDVASRLAKDPSLRHMLRRTVSVSLSAGYGVLPDEVLSEYMDESSIYDPTVLANDPLMTYDSEWMDFVRDRETRLGHYALKGSDGADRTIGWRNPNQLYAATLTKTGNVNLNVPCTPAIPAASTDPILVPDEITTEIQNILAQRIRGQIDKDTVEQAA